MPFLFERPRVSALAVAVALALCLPALAAPTGATAAPDFASQEATEISLGSASGQPGANVTVNLTVSGANVSSYQTSIAYDPDVVSVASVTGADFRAPTTNVESGRLNMTQVNVGGADDPTLARITFTLVGQPTNETALSFDEDATAIFDGDSEEIFIDSYSAGSVTVEAAPTPTPTASPTPTATSQPTSSNGGDPGGDSSTPS